MDHPSGVFGGLSVLAGICLFFQETSDARLQFLPKLFGAVLVVLGMMLLMIWGNITSEDEELLRMRHKRGR